MFLSNIGEYKADITHLHVSKPRPSEKGEVGGLVPRGATLALKRLAPRSGLLARPDPCCEVNCNIKSRAEVAAKHGRDPVMRRI